MDNQGEGVLFKFVKKNDAYYITTKNDERLAVQHGGDWFLVAKGLGKYNDQLFKIIDLGRTIQIISAHDSKKFAMLKGKSGQECHFFYNY